jgi:hypothetical protein
MKYKYTNSNANKLPVPTGSQRLAGRCRKRHVLAIAALAIVGALTALQGGVLCPGKPSGPSSFWQPTPTCMQGEETPGTPQCSINELPDGFQMGPCVTSDTPAHCEDGRSVLEAKKYWVRCVAVWECAYAYDENGDKILIEDNPSELDWSKVHDVGCAG